MGLDAQNKIKEDLTKAKSRITELEVRRISFTTRGLLMVCNKRYGPTIGDQLYNYWQLQELASIL